MLAGLVRVLGQRAAEIALLATRPECQGNGLASLLLAAMQGTCEALGVRLLLSPGMSPAVAPRLEEGEPTHVWSGLRQEGQDGQGPGTSWDAWLERQGFCAPEQGQLEALKHLPLLHRPGVPWLVKALPGKQVGPGVLPSLTWRAGGAHLQWPGGQVFDVRSKNLVSLPAWVSILAMTEPMCHTW